MNVPFTFLQIPNTSCSDNLVASAKSHTHPSGTHPHRKLCFSMGQGFETTTIAYLKREGQLYSANNSVNDLHLSEKHTLVYACDTAHLQGRKQNQCANLGPLKSLSA